MANLIKEEKKFCQYCKQPIDTNLQTNSHMTCEKLIKKYNNSIITKIRKNFSFNQNLKKKINWEKNKNIFYTVIYSLGGFNIISIIIIYQFLFGIRS